MSSAKQVYNDGGLLLYPSDTLWALGCNPRNEEAVQKVIQLKQRSSEKKFIVLVDTVSMLERYVGDLPAVAYDLIEYTESPLTLILDGAKHLAPSVPGEDGSLAVRVVKHGYCNQLLRSLNGPLLSTSANFSGKPSPTNFGEIDPLLVAACSFVERPEAAQLSGKSSTIIKMSTNGTFSILRK